MTRTEIVIIVIAVATIIVLAMRSGGPRVTTIETRRDRDEDGDDA